jgi:MGT family glycosyltransferase
VARFLVVVPPLTGHVNPTLAVGAALRERGHDVAWSGPPGLLPSLLPDGAEFIPTNDIEIADPIEAVRERSQGLRGPAALKFLWSDVLLPLARGMVDGTDRAVAGFRPDAVLVDQQALAGAVVARRRGLRWLTSATTSAELTDPLAALPQVDGWLRGELEALQVEAGIDPADAARGDLRFSDHGVLAFTTEALYGADQPRPANVHFVGPSIGSRPPDDDFPWDWLSDDVPHVLVSLGTLNAEAGGRFFTAAVEAFTDEKLQAVVVAPPELLPDPPPNVLVRAHVPQLALLPHLHAVVSHAGHNTVCESLANGLPLVVAPIRDDQPIIAEQVVRAGAGVRVRFGRARAADLRAAVADVLTDDRYRDAAAAIRRSFLAAGGPAAAADVLEDLACRP